MAIATPAPTVRHWHEPLDGADNALIRPYLHALEADAKARLQRMRRDALWCATYGVDIDVRQIHDHLGRTA
ncbi:hypothetical protein [Streptomyces sp. NBC_00356]|uniref:hypothetical protein n=1 Tax=Streptomyces sp. NBC_00356 TaxID=2975724 RepID=UPI002E25523E